MLLADVDVGVELCETVRDALRPALDDGETTGVLRSVTAAAVLVALFVGAAVP